jgi:hypothetical protein
MSQKTVYKFYCEKCDYVTTKKFDWKKHLCTTKHKNGNKMVTNGNKMVTNGNKKSRVSMKHVCKKCGKIYKFRSGLCRHKKKCKEYIENASLVSTQEEHLLPQKNEQTPENISHSLKLLAQSLAKQQCILGELVNVHKEMLPRLGNNNNNKISINFFLNEKCKNAMNLTDFVKNIKVSLEDLQYTNKHGYVKGISNIFQKNLTDLKVTERPIHCSDKKRLQFYVKDENKWEKDTAHEKINTGINTVGKKQIMQIKEWEKNHPHFLDRETQYMEWNKMIARVMGGTTDSSREKNIVNIKKQISGNIYVKDALGDDL